MSGKKIITILTAVMMIAGITCSTYAGTWESTGNGYKYKDDSGSYVSSKWGN